MASALMVGAMLLAGCGHRDAGDAEPAAGGAVEVRVETVDAGVGTVMREMPGTVRPKVQATVEAKVSGRMLELRAGAGSAVRRGDVLAVLDVEEIRARADQAAATQRHAAEELERAERLFGQGAGTRAELDAARARSGVAEAALREARTLAGHAEVRAPFDGVVTRRLADVGDLVGPGRPLFQVEDPGLLRMEVEVAESSIGSFRDGAEMLVRFPGAGLEGTGRVVEVAPASDPVSRTFLVKLDLPPVAGLRSGVFGRLVVPMGERPVMRVPLEALVRRGQLEIVFVEQGGKARLRLVKTGGDDGRRVEIASGLSAGESVVVSGAGVLRDGQPVKVLR